MIAILDYGAGNLFSVKNALDYLGVASCFTTDAAVLEAADGLILPGVGAFPEAMRRLHASGMVSALKAQVQHKPLLGICLGMQMLFDYGLEFERTEGLGLIPGFVRPIKADGLKLPHMGWNSLSLRQPCPLTTDTKEGDYVYFVHSFCAETDAAHIACDTPYGEPITALVHAGNVYGAQFHPEKSGEVGLTMLRRFAEVCK